jgi:hypothetical protein
VIEVIPCADVPYRCDGFDPADWEGEVPDFSPFREWEKRVQGTDVMYRALQSAAGRWCPPRRLLSALRSS